MNNLNITNNEFTDLLRIEGINAKGFGIIPKLVMQDRRLTIDAKGIYAYIRSFAGSGDTAFPSVKKMMYDLCFKSEDTFRKHRKLLEQFGYLRVEQTKNENGRFNRNIYTLIDKPEEITDTQNLSNGENTVQPTYLSVAQILRHGKNRAQKKLVYNNNSGFKTNNFVKNNNTKEQEAVVEKIEEVKAFIKETLSQEEVGCLLSAANNDCDKIRQAYGQIKNYRGKVENLVGLLKNAILKPWSNIEIQSTNKTQNQYGYRNRFINFEQPTHDFDHLEQLEREYIQKGLENVKIDSKYLEKIR